MSSDSDSHDFSRTKPSKQGSTKKRKRRPDEQAKIDATAAKKAAIAFEVARGPLPMRWAPDGTFLPQYMPEGLFDSDKPGERWAAHPKYPPSEVLVSNYGNVRMRGRHAGVGEYECFTVGSLRKSGYRTVRINGKPKLVHILVCEAFHGPRPSKRHTVDHFRDRNRSNNRANNLRWATQKEQNKNQDTRRAKSTGKPVFARKVGSPDDAEWTPYASVLAASKALGIHISHISGVCNPKKSRHTAGGYEFRYDLSACEPQDDLPAKWVETPDGPLQVPKEEWKLDPMSNGRTCVSTRGRVQTKTPRGDDNWSLRYTPKAASGEEYTKVNGNRVHLVVWRTFCSDDPPRDGKTIDHIDRDTANNALHNLRCATPSDQSRNRDMPSADDQARPRTPVLAWKDGEARTTAERFVGQHAAARELNARFGTTKFTHCSIGSAANAKRGPGKHNGWRFAFVPETEEEIAARAAQRARVCAAIEALWQQEATHADREAATVPSEASDDDDDEEGNTTDDSMSW